MKTLSLEELINRVEDVPVFPHVISSIIRLAEDPESSIEDIEKEILKDQGLTTKVLRLANSAYYGASRKISTIAEAVILLGFQAVKGIVLATTVSRILVKELPGYGLKKDELWRQSQAAAITARLVSKEVGFSKSDEAYIAGLLRDVGKVILDHYLTEQYSKIIELVDNERISFIEAEERILGFNHGEVGAKIAEKWNLPQQLVEAIAYHHCPGKASQSCIKLVSITHLADAIVMSMGIHIGHDGLTYEFSPSSMEALRLSEEKLHHIMSEVADLLADEDVFYNGHGG